MYNLYFDIAATTPMDNDVIELINKVQTNIFGNPSSIHQFGQKSRSLIEKARRQMSNALNCNPDEIIFTGGGSESNNLVLQGSLKKGDHFITSSYEHPAIIEVAKELQKRGVEVSYVRPQSNGTINPKDVESNIRDNTVLISIMYINNEIGCINPIEKIIKIAKKHNIKMHTDAVQLIGKKHINLKMLGIDFLSIAAHKYYGPKGIGALFIKKGAPLQSILQGGGQEQNIRPGTENITGIAGMGLATQIAIKNIEFNCKKILRLETLFLNSLNDKKIIYTLNGTNRIPGILNITFPNILGQNLVMRLDMNGIAVSFGSACSSGTPKPSNVLLDLGVSDKDALKTVRISIGKFHKNEDIIKLANTIETILEAELKRTQNNYV